MDVMLQRHCARYIYVVPEGLRELMSDISREVLRTQPEDIYTFIADYLDALMITRENARVAAKFVQELTECAETIVDLLERSGMSRDEADRVATIIQRHFRAYIEKKGILKESDEKLALDIIEEAQIPEAQAELAAIVIQNSFRSFKARREKQKELLSGVIDWRVAARSAIKLYRRTGVSAEEAKRAADLIKAAYRGYYTRRTLLKLKEETARLAEEEGEMSEESYEDEETSSIDSETGLKKKTVRIDYSSVVPHVDFQEPDGSSQASEAKLQTTSSEEFIKDLLMTTILSPVLKEPVTELLDTIDELPIDEHDDTIIDFYLEEPPIGQEIIEEQLPTEETQEVTQEVQEESQEVPEAPQEIQEEVTAIVEEAPEEQVQEVVAPAEPEALPEQEAEIPDTPTTTAESETTELTSTTPGDTTEGYTSETDTEATAET